MAGSTMRVIETHTGGEPTRVIVAGGPGLGAGSLFERRERMGREYDRFRTAIINEPRGAEVMIGAMLTEPVDPNCAAGVIFFNNVGYLNMCGHGTLGVGAALEYLGRLGPGQHRLETPVGDIGLEALGENRYAVENVVSYRHRSQVEVQVEGVGTVRGDIAWGGNWFFLIGEHDERIALD
ncbi:MAG: proline racemase family protein, partial [Planctomycetaceae bacterium]